MSSAHQLFTTAILFGPEVAANVAWFTAEDVGSIESVSLYGEKKCFQNVLHF